MERINRFYTLSASPDPANTYSLSLEDLHPVVQQVSGALYRDGHFSQAVFEAFKALNNYVKERSGCRSKDGSALMAHVFDERAPILALNPMNSQSQLDEQLGFKLIMMGVMTGIRNPVAHENLRMSDPTRAMEQLALASFLVRRVDESQRVR